MAEPEFPPQPSPGAPTPEDISARLEALLKRTHSLRAERAAGAAAGMTWPPPDRELDHYEVVDATDGTPAATTDAPARAAAADSPDPEDDAAAVVATPARPLTAPSPRDGGDPASGFARPDWAELRLRGYTDERPRRSTWPWVVAALLATLAVAEGIYIWQLRTAHGAPAEGRLRVDGPAGAEVRVNGEVVGTAPVDQALAAGAYSVEIRQHGASARADDVIMGLGRTVLLVTPTPGVDADTPAPASAGPAPDASAPTPSAPVQLPADVALTVTTGAVVIESTPPGMPVTMEGRPRGVTPVTIGDLKPGRHDVMVGRLFRQVDVRANEATTLRVP